jgi:predicted secreted Zn-dependent protease
MPRWVNYTAATDGMKAAWDNYYQAIFKHEEAHSDYGIAAAREIQRQLPELTGRYSCKDLKEDGTQLAKKILKTYREKDEAHDRTSLNSDMVTDVEIAADQREGVLGRQHPERQGLPAH